jgi:hypothetical protein
MTGERNAAAQQDFVDGFCSEDLGSLLTQKARLITVGHLWNVQPER